MEILHAVHHHIYLKIPMAYTIQKSCYVQVLQAELVQLPLPDSISKIKNQHYLAVCQAQSGVIYGATVTINYFFVFKLLYSVNHRSTGKPQFSGYFRSL